MSQAWLSVAGLTCDFVGFILLLREWWIAFLSESALLSHEEALERQQKLRAFAQQNAAGTMKRHLAVAGQMQDDMAVRQAREGRRAAMKGRRFWFLSAAAFIVLGFLLQAAGAIPLGDLRFAP